MMDRQVVLAGIGLTLLYGCGGTDPGPVCDEYAAPGIVVTLADSTTDARIPSGIASVRAADGAYADSARVALEQYPQNQAFPLAYERPGIYRVDVTVTGYRPWTRDGIFVRMESDGCHIETRSIRALMQKAS